MWIKFSHLHSTKGREPYGLFVLLVQLDFTIHQNLLIHKLSQFNEKSYIYNEIIAFLISISSKKVIPYIEKILFTQSKIDDEIYTELKNNLSDEFAELRKKLLEEFK